MNENDESKNVKSKIKSLDELSSEYSYLDYIIDKKFYRRFWKILATILTIFGLILAGLTFLGISTYVDLMKYYNHVENVKERIDPLYNEYVIKDKIKEENSKYYAFHVAHNNKYRGAIIGAFRDYGFKFKDSIVEDGLNEFIYNNPQADSNAARLFVIAKSEDEKEKYIGILYNGISYEMRIRMDSIFAEIYGAANVKYFKSEKIPPMGILYYIE